MSSLITHYVGRRAYIFQSVCLSVCLSVCPQRNSETNDLKVFKLGVRNDLWISYRSADMVSGFKGQGEGYIVEYRVRVQQSCGGVRTL